MNICAKTYTRFCKNLEGGSLNIYQSEQFFRTKVVEKNVTVYVEYILS
jgi:hypothetical protein